MEGGISMAKNLMMSAQATGINPMVAGESLTRALTDRMALHGALFARLVNTQAFKQQHVVSQQQVMGMNPDRKIDLIAKALEQLGGNAEFAKYRLDQLETKFIVLRDQIEDFLQPIGDAIKKPLKLVLDWANTWLAQHGKELGESIKKLLGDFLESPKQLILNLMQLKSFASDFKTAFHFTELFQMFMLLRWGLGLLGVELGGGLLQRGFVLVLSSLRTMVAWLWEVGAFGMMFNLLRSALVAVGEVFVPILFFLQIISRARNIALLADAENLVNLLPKLTALFVRIKDAVSQILLPVWLAIDGIANLIAPLFETTTWINIALPLFSLLADGLEYLGVAMHYLMAASSGLMGIYNIIHMQNPFGDALANFKAGFDQFDRDHPMARQGGVPTSKSVVYNNNHIEARFDMREQLEPDRIAFAVTTHLKKLALNPTQGRMNSLSGGMANAQISAGA